MCWFIRKPVYIPIALKHPNLAAIPCHGNRVHAIATVNVFHQLHQCRSLLKQHQWIHHIKKVPSREPCFLIKKLIFPNVCQKAKIKM
jgi:hypothetical protein